MADLVQFPGARRSSRPLSKKQLATELGRSSRWINLRMTEGMPVLPRASEQEPARFDLGQVNAWLEERANVRPMTLEERVAMLERTVRSLTDRKAS